MRKQSVWFSAFLCAFLCLALAACGGDGDGNSEGGGSGDAAGGGGEDGEPSDGPTAEPPDLEAFTAIDVAGYKRGMARTTPAGLLARYEREAKTASGATLWVQLNASPCTSFTCGKLTKDMDRKQLLQDLPPAHHENPDLVLEVDEITLGAAKGVTSYARSYMEKKGDAGTSRMSAHALRAWAHDGTTLLTVYVYAQGGTRAKSADDLKTQMTKAEAVQAVKDVHAAFQGLFPAD